MESQPFTRAFGIMLASALALLLFPVFQEHVPWLTHIARPYSFFRPFLRAPAPQTAAPESDTIAGASIPELLLPRYDGRDHLQPFYRTLRRSSEQVRIAHYGDSSIEGDLITASFRDSLQKRFGGSGIGFVPLVNPIAGFRRTLRHSFSGNWYHVYLGKANAAGLPRGPSGAYVSTWSPSDTTGNTPDGVVADTTRPADDYWVSLGNTSLFAAGRSFPSARLFYGPSKRDTAGGAPPPGRVTVSGLEKPVEFPLDGRNLINQQVLADQPCRRLLLRFLTPPTQPLYGVSLESKEGVIVDNFPSRGNSGIALTHIDAKLLTEFQQLVDYDLLMVQFGLNSLNPDMVDYRWYTLEMVQVIHHLKTAFPGIPVLVLGPSDRAIKRNNRMQTDPSVPRITDALRQAAEQTDAAFFSFYEAMGGQGAMVKWVEDSTPPLANADYTHFNFEGGRRAAFMLLDFLLAGYQHYLDTIETKAHALH